MINGKLYLKEVTHLLVYKTAPKCKEFIIALIKFTPYQRIFKYFKTVLIFVLNVSFATNIVNVEEQRKNRVYRCEYYFSSTI